MQQKIKIWCCFAVIREERINLTRGDLVEIEPAGFIDLEAVALGTGCENQFAAPRGKRMSWMDRSRKRRGRVWWRLLGVGTLANWQIALLVIVASIVGNWNSQSLFLVLFPHQL
jgi:hypothetical protein